MKALLVVLAMMFSFSGLAMADPLIDWFEDFEDDQQRLSLDAPYLVRIGDDWALGAEVSKDIHNTNTDQGWAFTTRVTYMRTLKSIFQKS